MPPRPSKMGGSSGLSSNSSIRTQVGPWAGVFDSLVYPWHAAIMSTGCFKRRYLVETFIFRGVDLALARGGNISLALRKTFGWTAWLCLVPILNPGCLYVSHVKYTRLMLKMITRNTEGEVTDCIGTFGMYKLALCGNPCPYCQSISVPSTRRIAGRNHS